MPARKFLAALTIAAGLSSAQASPSLVVDAATGEILHQEQATQPWFPASITKLMTVYVALKAVREGRLTLDTPLIVSSRANRMAPSKMGFRPGAEVTLDNALKILMVKSANDVSVTVAEGISGSVEAFADLMNAAAAGIGMRESRWHNPNGLPDARQVTSARDMALLARALLREFPEHAGLFGIGALQLGSRIIPTHNGLIGRYPGADGMKTGFTCAAGFNVVASATRGGRRLIAVVLGAPSARDRTAKAANLFDRAFAGGGSSGNLANLPTTEGAPPDQRGIACTRRSKGGGYLSEIEDFSVPLASIQQQLERNPEREFLFEAAGLLRPQPAGRNIALLDRPHFVPVPIFVGRAPGWAGAALGPTRFARAGEPRKPPPSQPPVAAARAFAPQEAPIAAATEKAVFADPLEGPLQLPGALAEPTPAKKAQKASKPSVAKKVAKLEKSKPARGK